MKEKNCDTPIRILQFGEGNFLRAFVDWMIQKLNDSKPEKIGVAIVPPRFRPNDAIRLLKEQGGVYHVILEGIKDGEPVRESQCVECIKEIILPLEEPERYESVILSPDLRFVVSNTTEAGIRMEKDDILSDFPNTFPGKIASLLYRRWTHFNGDYTKGLVFLPCELIEDNGSTLKEYVISHAKEASLSESFIDWVANANIWCDTLVDRIVSGYPTEDAEDWKSRLNTTDGCMVKGEMYHLWAIGGDRVEEVSKELPLREAGLNVLFLPSVKEFREQKVRILNGSHTGMVAMSLLAGYETVGEAFASPEISGFIQKMMDEEVIAALGGDRDELDLFAKDTFRRFMNPFIHHSLKAISLNSVSKWDARNYPSVKDYYAKFGSYPRHLLFTFAALLYLYSHPDKFVPTDDARAIEIIRKGDVGSGDEEVIKEILSSGIFSEDFESVIPGFSKEVGRYCKLINEKGIIEVLKEI